ncbi:D-2-hydroxyacid dehydrogenase family protein [Gaiella sp.]|uniref:D-2-hydroxyacid dehydrogenase family protein n=1 Tax=Gaiella sp. TaxID=2663207 RepID=UPI00398355B0
MRVVVMEDYQRAVERLRCFSDVTDHEIVVHAARPTTVAERAAQIGDAEALVLIRERTPIDSSLLDRVPDLRLICQTGRGMPHIDLTACTERGIVVCSGGGSSYAPAELTLALILASSRRIVEDAVALRSGTWQSTIGVELNGKTLGIVGYGAIGALVARYGVALGMHVLAWGREGSLARARADGHEPERELGSLFTRADVVSLQLKLSPETRGIVTRPHLAAMKPDALLVNTARAGLIEPGALDAALRAGRPGRAAIDVFDDEPAIEDPILHHPSVLATPHLGYVTWETYESYFAEAFAQLDAFAAGAPIGVANPEPPTRP